MNKYLDKLANLPVLQRAGIGVLLILLVLGGFWQFLYTDLNIKSSELEQEVEGLETKIIQERKISRNLEKYQAEAKEQDELLANVLRELPDRKEIEGFLRSISVLAIDTGLEVLEFTPLPEAKVDYLANLPVDIKLEGTFHQLLTFFDEVAHLPRIVNIDKVSLNVLKEAGEEIVLQFNCRATTFRYLDESERPVVGEEGEQSKRRRR
jgi:type IV pilus assembly protein PilO